MTEILHKKRKVHRRFTGTYKYPEWFNKQKYIFCEAMMERLDKLVWIHSQSANYYEKRHFRIFVPNITITAFSGIASFLSTSQFITNETQTAFGITVGILASISALVQSVASVTRYSAKAEAHQSAADEYSKLLIRLKFEIAMPNEPDFIDTLEESILEIQNKCNYFPPQSIVNDYYRTLVKNIKNQQEINNIYSELTKDGSDSLASQSTNSSLELSPKNDNILINIETGVYSDVESSNSQENPSASQV